MRNLKLPNVIGVTIFVFMLATFVNGQSIERPHPGKDIEIEYGYTVGIRTVAGEPNLYLTVGGICGPDITIQARAGERENQVSQSQVFEIIDLNGGTLQYGDRIRIRRCNNYVRVDSEKRLASMRPLNKDGTPDTATVFTILEPPHPALKTQPGFFVLFKSEENGLYVTHPEGEQNGLGRSLGTVSDFAGNNRNVFKLIPLAYQSDEEIRGGVISERNGEPNSRESNSGGPNRSPAGGAKRVVEFVIKHEREYNDQLDEADRKTHNRENNPRPTPSDKPDKPDKP